MIWIRSIHQIKGWNKSAETSVLMAGIRMTPWRQYSL